jgi:hypothetical protein
MSVSASTTANSPTVAFSMWKPTSHDSALKTMTSVGATAAVDSFGSESGSSGARLLTSASRTSLAFRVTLRT